MKIASHFIYIFAAFATVSCKNKVEQKDHHIEIANWLIGNWEHQTEFGNLSEQWQQLNDSTYVGKAFFTKGKDTLHNESITLHEQGNDLIYSATVKDENEALPVAFKLTSETANQLVFENPKHDFPQKITYKKITSDSIVAIVSGVEQGKPASETYPMTRTKK